MDRVIRPFCWHQNFVCWGLSWPRLYTCIKSWKKLYKIRLQRDFFYKLATNEWSDKTFLLTSKLCPLRVVCSCLGAIYMYKIMKKKMYKSRHKEIFLKLATNDRNGKMFLLTSKFRPQGVVSPAPGLLYKIIKKKCIKSDFKEIFLKLVANDPSDKRFLLTSKFCPLRLPSPDLWLYTSIKSWKDVYKVRDWRHSFKTCNKWP